MSSVSPVARTRPAGEPRLDFVTCASPAGLHRMAYWEWGDPDNDRVLLCVHGLTRTGRDFDPLACALDREYRVVCPDVVGRGRSDWLIDPNGYVIPQYVADMLTLLARLRPARLDWVGTSMGGLIGLGLAGMATMSPALRPARGPGGLGAVADVPLGRMVFNDIGPALDASGLARIGAYVGQALRFDRFEQAVDYVRTVSAGFGPHDPAGWRALTEHVFVEQNGQWIKHYDLRLAQPFALQTPEATTAAEALLWQAWDHLPVPSLILRGAQSDILTQDAARRMTERNPRARLVEFDGVGHAPTLRTDAQIAAVRDFLLAP
ncbi:MAG: alpha/beta hydrolase [Castellaniella sp.]|uniref:alpha/beta fold hydrolase n=1 Tax=Castellaniella sp. TaxID=1955812 RepID=UPI002A3695E3|nr:alpha/beta hydrolase [Castellaniella sp.]MDY0308573.1 alpha/beta hydrolase [Castellaniella sp.]